MDIIHAISQSMEFDDDDGGEEEVDVDQVPPTPDNAAEIPDLPPLVPPAGAGIPSEKSAGTREQPETLIVEVPSDELPGTTEGLKGLVLGVAFFAVGWMVIRWL
jgi:hypothetical protein